MSLKSRKLLMLLVILTLALPLNLLPASAAPSIRQAWDRLNGSAIQQDLRPLESDNGCVR